MFVYGVLGWDKKTTGVFPQKGMHAEVCMTFKRKLKKKKKRSQPVRHLPACQPMPYRHIFSLRKLISLYQSHFTLLSTLLPILLCPLPKSRFL